MRRTRRPFEDLSAAARPHWRTRGACALAGGALLSPLLHGCVIRLSTYPPPEDAGSSSTVDGSHSGSTSGSPGDAASDATRPTGGWVNVTGNLASLTAMCGTLTMVSTKPDEDLLIAGLANVGLYGSRDGGKTWQPLGATSDAGQVIMNRPEAIVYDPKVTTRFWEAGVYAGSPFITNDDGRTWTQLGDIMHSDLVSVDFTDTARKTLLAGGHEASKTLCRSTNSGVTWTNIYEGLPANTSCTFPMIVDTQTYLVGCSDYGGSPPGIYRTTDSGGTWTKMTSSGGGAAPLLASDGAIYWVSANNAGMTRSLDSGKTWTDVGDGVVTTNRPVELSGGRIAALGTDYVMVSSDQGVTWTPATSPLPTPANEYLADASLAVVTQGLAYSTQRKAFYIWHNTCGFGAPVPIPSDAVMSFDFE